MNDNYIEVKTTDHQTVFINKSEIGAIEEGSETSRSVPHTRVYVSGYKFTIKGTIEEFIALLK